MNERLDNLKNSEVKQIQNRVNMAYYDQQIGQRQFKVNSLTGDDAITKGLRKKAEADLQAWKNLRDEYAKKAKEILNASPTVSNKQIKPTTETTDTNKSRTTGSNKTLKPEKDDMVEIVGLIGEANERVSDLQKRMRESWDQNEIATLRKQLKEAQNDLDVLQGKLPKDSKVEMTITADDTDALQKVKDIEDVTFDEKTMTVTANTQEALQMVQELVADIDGKVVNVKVVPLITDEDIDKQLQRQYGKAIQVPITPKLTAGEELVQSIRIKLAEDNINADMQTLRTLLETQIKNGIEGIDIPTDMLMQAIIGEGLNIPDKYWKNLQEKINEKLKEMGIDQLDIDFETGESKKKDKKEKSPIEGSKQLVSGLSQVAGGLKAIGVELPKEVDQVLGAINGVSQIISGVGIIISIFGTTAITSNTTAVGLNTAAIAGLITALEFNSATNFFGFAGGGIVPHAANGYFVGGTHMSGDVTPIMANAGELVLSKSQQGVLASMLTDGDRGGVGGSSSLPYVDGETIYLGLKNYLMRSGRGEIVTTRR